MSTSLLTYNRIKTLGAILSIHRLEGPGRTKVYTISR